MKIERIDIDGSRHLVADYVMEIGAILQHAVRLAVIDHKRAGNPIASWENGRVVILQPEEIVIPEVGAE